MTVAGDGAFPAESLALSREERDRIERQVAEFVALLIRLEPLGPDYSEQVATIAAIGQRDIFALGDCCERAMARAQAHSAGNVGAPLAGLRRLAASLDPQAAGGLLNPGRSLFRKAPDPAAYFARYTAAQDDILRVLAGLESARDDLLRQQVRSAAEQDQLVAAMRRLELARRQARRLTSRLEAEAHLLADHDPLRAHKLRTDALSQAQSRSAELVTQMTLAQQAWLALDLIERGNAQLIAAITRAHAAMLKALRAARRAAEALTNRGLVLDKVAALQAATTRITELGEEGRTGDAKDALARSFVDLVAALDAIEAAEAQAPRASG